MKRLIPVLAVLVACLVCVPTVLAQSGRRCASGADDPFSDLPVFCVAGSVTAIDSAAGTLSVAIDESLTDLSGSVSVNITDATEILSVSDIDLLSLSSSEGATLSLADIAVGDEVAIYGSVDESSGTAVYTASLLCACVPIFACEGSVTAINDTSSDALAVAVESGSGDLPATLHVNITNDTLLYSLSDFTPTTLTLADINVGDEVALFGTVDESSGTAVYAASDVLDCGAAANLPQPFCRPASMKVKAAAAGKGDTLKIPVKVADTMPGNGTAKVALVVTNHKGRKLAFAKVTGVRVNTKTSVSCKLKKPLAKGTYKIVAKATDWAGNKQAKPATATLKVT